MNERELRFVLEAERRGYQILVSGYPDFLVMPGNFKPYFVEVRSSPHFLDSQIKMIDALREIGADVLVSKNGRWVEPDYMIPKHSKNKMETIKELGQNKIDKLKDEIGKLRKTIMILESALAFEIWFRLTKMPPCPPTTITEENRQQVSELMAMFYLNAVVHGYEINQYISRLEGREPMYASCRPLDENGKEFDFLKLIQRFRRAYSFERDKERNLKDTVFDFVQELCEF